MLNYGLTGNPFSLLPDADFLYPSKRHKRALNLLEYGLVSQAGFIIITGDVGAGKTTVVRRFLRSGRLEKLEVGLVTNATTTLGDLMSWISMAFDLEHHGKDHVALYNQFVEFVLARYAEGKRTLIIVDEAQNSSLQMLEDLRMLSNINNEKDLLLQIMLVGQPELLETLKRPELRQFVQRVSAHYHLTPISCRETVNYIHHRLSVAGGPPELFGEVACAAVYYFSGGVPRLINLLCDQAMVYAFADELPAVPFDAVIDVAADRGAGGLSPFRVPSTGSTKEMLRQEFVQLLAASEAGQAAEQPA